MDQLLLETGGSDYLLLETGGSDYLLLESSGAASGGGINLIGQDGIMGANLLGNGTLVIA